MSRPRVLIVDDNPDNLEYAAQVLEDVYRVEVATSGTAGLAEAGKCPPELILLDISLPRRDGWAILRELRRDPVLRDVPVVACTANLLAAEAATERPSSRFDAYLFKPYRPRELRSLVAAFVGPGEP